MSGSKILIEPVARTPGVGGRKEMRFHEATNRRKSVPPPRKMRRLAVAGNNPIQRRTATLRELPAVWLL